MARNMALGIMAGLAALACRPENAPVGVTGAGLAPLPENSQWKISGKELETKLLTGAKDYCRSLPGFHTRQRKDYASAVGNCQSALGLLENREDRPCRPVAILAAYGSTSAGEPYFKVLGINPNRETHRALLMASGPDGITVRIVCEVKLHEKEFEMISEPFFIGIEYLPWETLVWRASPGDGGVLELVIPDGQQVPIVESEDVQLAAALKDRVGGLGNFVPVFRWDARVDRDGKNAESAPETHAHSGAETATHHGDADSINRR